MINLQRDVLDIFLRGETSEQQLEDYVKLWKPLIDKGFIDSVQSAVIGTLFGKASLYFRFINYNTEISDEQIDMFNELFTDTITSNLENIRSLVSEKDE